MAGQDVMEEKEQRILLLCEVEEADKTPECADQESVYTEQDCQLKQDLSENDGKDGEAHGTDIEEPDEKNVNADITEQLEGKYGKNTSRPGSSIHISRNTIDQIIEAEEEASVNVEVDYEIQTEECGSLRGEEVMLSHTSGKTEEYEESESRIEKQETNEQTESEENIQREQMYCVFEPVEDERLQLKEESLKQVYDKNEDADDPSNCNQETTDRPIETTEEEKDDLINKEDLELMMKNFALFDTENTGYISCSDLGNYTRSLGIIPTDEEVNNIIGGVEECEEGQFKLSQLLKNAGLQILLSNKAVPEDFQRAFEVFDYDKSGMISSEELMKVLTQFGEMKLSLEEAEEMISLVDTDKDSMMNYMEFVTLFTQAMQ